MKRVIVDRYGGPEVLKVVEAEVPRPGQGEGGMYGEAQDLDHIEPGCRGNAASQGSSANDGAKPAGANSQEERSVTARACSGDPRSDSKRVVRRRALSPRSRPAHTPFGVGPAAAGGVSALPPDAASVRRLIVPRKNGSEKPARKPTAAIAECASTVSNA